MRPVPSPKYEALLTARAPREQGGGGGWSREGGWRGGRGGGEGRRGGGEGGGREGLVISVMSYREILNYAYTTRWKLINNIDLDKKTSLTVSQVFFFLFTSFVNYSSSVD